MKHIVIGAENRRQPVDAAAAGTKSKEKPRPITNQLSFDVPEIFHGYDGKTLQYFKEYHSSRPEIYEAFRKYAFQMLKSGRRHYGAKGIMERIRWEHNLQYPEQSFKIGNSMTAIYARLIAYHHPEFKEFFSFRKVKGIRRPSFEKKHVAEFNPDGESEYHTQDPRADRW